MQKNPRTNDEKIRCGLIVSLFISFFTCIVKLVKNSFFIGLLTDYKAIKNAADKSKISATVSFFRKLKHKLLKIRLSFARLAERSIFMRMLDRAGNVLFRTSLRSVGVFFLSAGAVIVIAYIAQRNESIMSLKFSNTFIMGVLMMLVSLVFIVKKNTSISQCIRDSRFLSYFFVDIFQLKHLSNNEGVNVRNTSAYAFIFGVAFGSLSYAVSPVLSFFILGVVAYLYLIFTKPENGILLICMQLPVLSEELLLFLIGATVTSFVFKAIRGKRSIGLNLCSGAIAVTGLIFVSCTVISYDNQGSFMQALPFLAAILLAVCVIMTVKSSSLADKCFRMLGLSTILSVLWGINSTVVNLIIEETGLSDILSVAMQDFSGSFSSSSACSAFLIVMIPFFIIKHPEPTAIFSFPSLAFVMLGLFLCNNYYAVASLMAAILISMCVFGKHRIITTIISAGAWLVMQFGIPALFNKSYPTVSDNGFRSVKQLVDYFEVHGFAGCGMGNEAIAYSCLDQGINASHIDKSFGVYTDLTMRLGIPLVVICFMLILLFVSRTVSYALVKHNSESAKSKCTALFTSITAAGIFALYSDYIYDFRILALLFLVLGMSSAIPDSADADYIPPEVFPEHDCIEKE